MVASTRSQVIHYFAESYKSDGATTCGLILDAIAIAEETTSPAGATPEQYFLGAEYEPASVPFDAAVRVQLGRLFAEARAGEDAARAQALAAELETAVANGRQAAEAARQADSVASDLRHENESLRSQLVAAQHEVARLEAWVAKHGAAESASSKEA